MKPYPDYKPTGLAWLPEIPKHWTTRKIKYIFRERSEKGYPDEPLLAATQNHGVIPKNLYGARTVEAQKDLHLLKLVRVGDFVISLRSFQGGIEYAYYQGIISPAYTIMIPDSCLIDSGYFRYLAKSPNFIALLQTCVTGIREGQNIDYSTLRRHCLPLPPADEQAQIVRYLDAMTAKINKLIRAKKRQIALLQEQKQAIINQAVTRGLDPDVELKDSGIDWLGPIPKQWKLPHLAFFTTKIGSGKTPKGGAEIYQDSGVMFIRSQNVYFNTLQTEDISYISPEMDATMSNTRVYYEDVLLNITGGSIGRCCVYREHMPANVNQHVCIIRCKKSLIIPDYLANVLFSHVGQNSIMFCQNEGNRESLTFPQIGAFCVPLPDLGEQNDILKYLAKKTKSIDVAIDKINQEIQIFSELKNSYISFVVTGQVDVRNIAVEEVDPADLIAETDDDPTGEESPEESEE